MKYEVGKRLIERGDFACAERYFRSFDPYVVMHYVPSQYQLGRVYEAMGEPEKAREHYLTFIRWWRDPDPYLVPWRRDAEDALLRLTGDDQAPRPPPGSGTEAPLRAPAKPPAQSRLQPAGR